MAEVNPYNVKPVFKDKYYVYALCKPNGDVFYIGKGMKARELATKYSTSQQTIRLIRRCEGRFKDYRDYAIEKGITQWLEVKAY